MSKHSQYNHKVYSYGIYGSVHTVFNHHSFIFNHFQLTPGLTRCYICCAWSVHVFCGARTIWAALTRDVKPGLVQAQGAWICWRGLNKTTTTIPYRFSGGFLFFFEIHLQQNQELDIDRLSSSNPAIVTDKLLIQPPAGYQGVVCATKDSLHGECQSQICRGEWLTIWPSAAMSTSVLFSDLFTIWNEH